MFVVRALALNKLQKSRYFKDSGEYVQFQHIH